MYGFAEKDGKSTEKVRDVTSVFTEVEGRADMVAAKKNNSARILMNNDPDACIPSVAIDKFYMATQEYTPGQVYGVLFGSFESPMQGMSKRSIMKRLLLGRFSDFSVKIIADIENSSGLHVQVGR